MEEELKLLQAALDAPGQPGVKGELIDEEGFPKADLDLYDIRRKRN